jgi:MFS family permease
MIFTTFSAGAYLTSDYHLAFALLTVSAVGGAAINGPMFATIQTLVPPRMRATAIALLYFFSNLIGMGLGPLAVGALSDGLQPRFGEDSLRYALLALCPGYFWAAWHAWQAGRAVTGAIAASVAQETVGEVQR